MAGLLGIRFIGRKAFEARMAQAGARFENELETNIRKAGEVVIGRAQREFKGSRTRALYEIRGGRKRKRKNPRPITAPRNMLAVFEGTYRKTITQDVNRRGKRRFRTEIGPTVPYARRHELGTGGMPQRQVLTPGVQKSEREVVRLLGTTFRVV